MNKTDKCLLCDNDVHARGLCTLHHQQFTREKKKLPQELKEAFERHAIENKMILPIAGPAENPFIEIAAKIAEASAHYKADDDKAAENKKALGKVRSKAKPKRND